MTDAPVRHLPEPPPSTHGGRVELRLLALEGPSVARYEALFFVDGQRFEGELVAELGPPARVALTAPMVGVPEWLTDFAVTLLRTSTRSASRTGFPRRLTRWRAGNGSVSDE